MNYMTMILAAMLTMAATTAFAKKCKFDKSELMDISLTNGKMKLLSPKLKQQKIELKFFTALMKSSSFSESGRRTHCEDRKSVLVMETGDYILPQIPKSLEMFHIYVDSLWIIEQFKTYHFDKEQINALADSRNTYTLVHLDTSKVFKMYNNGPSYPAINKLNVHVTERFRHHNNNGSKLVEYLFDRDLNEGDEVWVNIHDDCFDNRELNACWFRVQDGILVSSRI